MNERNFSAVPKSACMFGGGTVEIGDNGKTAKSAPIRLKARSGGSIEHWYWGRVVHDLSGMKLHKQRLTIDYAHNDAEVLGYLNHFDVGNGDLIASGALTPWREDDRASEVMYKMREGVPYEASIFFGGDGVKVEEVPEGQTMQVNGREFAGPGVIIREWPLRGVAICPYGADQNTKASAFGQETVNVEKWKKEKNMEANKNPVEAEIKAEGAVALVEAEVVEAEDKPVEAAPEKPEDVAAEIEALKAERDAIKAEIEALKKERDEIKAEDQPEVTPEKPMDEGDEMKQVKEQLAAAMHRLSVIEAGAPPLSSNHVPEARDVSAWKKAQKTRPVKRA